MVASQSHMSSLSHLINIFTTLTIINESPRIQRSLIEFGPKKYEKFKK